MIRNIFEEIKRFMIYIGNKIVEILNIGSKSEPDVYLGSTKVYPDANYTYTLTGVSLIYSNNGTVLLENNSNYAYLQGTYNTYKNGTLESSETVKLTPSFSGDYISVSNNNMYWNQAYSGASQVRKTITVIGSYNGIYSDYFNVVLEAYTYHNYVLEWYNDSQTPRNIASGANTLSFLIVSKDVDEVVDITSDDIAISQYGSLTNIIKQSPGTHIIIVSVTENTLPAIRSTTITITQPNSHKQITGVILQAAKETPSETRTYDGLSDVKSTSGIWKVGTITTQSTQYYTIQNFVVTCGNSAPTNTNTKVTYKVTLSNGNVQEGTFDYGTASSKSVTDYEGNTLYGKSIYGFNTSQGITISSVDTFQVTTY